MDGLGPVGAGADFAAQSIESEAPAAAPEDAALPEAPAQQLPAGAAGGDMAAAHANDIGAALVQGSLLDAPVGQAAPTAPTAREILKQLDDNLREVTRTLEAGGHKEVAVIVEQARVGMDTDARDHAPTGYGGIVNPKTGKIDGYGMPPADIQERAKKLREDTSIPPGTKVVVRSADPPDGDGKRYALCVTKHPYAVADPSKRDVRGVSAYVQKP